MNNNLSASPILQSGSQKSKILDQGQALKLFQTYVPELGASTLDLGCSDGFFLDQLKAKGYQNLFGAEANLYGEDKANIKVADFSYDKLFWEDNSFDAVTAWEVFEHLENPYFAIREVRRVLKPGGIFMLSMPNPFHWLSRTLFFLRGDLPRWNGKNDHIAIFTNKLFKRAFLNDKFSLLERSFAVPMLSQKVKNRFFNAVRWADRYLPSNQTFGTFIVYVLRTKKST